MNPTQTEYAEKWLAMRKKTLKMRGLSSEVALPDLSRYDLSDLEELIEAESFQLEISRMMGTQRRVARLLKKHKT